MRHRSDNFHIACMFKYDFSMLLFKQGSVDVFSVRGGE